MEPSGHFSNDIPTHAVIQGTAHIVFAVQLGQAVFKSGHRSHGDSHFQYFGFGRSPYINKNIFK
ncbi:hypothetical protein D9M70_598150 [compost metagenome]